MGKATGEEVGIRRGNDIIKIGCLQFWLLVVAIVSFKTPIVYAQSCEPIQVASAGDKYLVNVDKDSAHVNLHKNRYSTVAACVNILKAGFYKIYPGVEYSLDQWNESFYLEFRQSNNSISPQLDPNAGNYFVVQDSSGEPSVSRRYAGKFYLEPGGHRIILNHYYLIHEEFPGFLNTPNEHLDQGNPESVHLLYFEFEYEGDRTRNFDLKISKTASKDTVKINEVFNYELTVENCGPASAYQIMVSDTLSAPISAYNFDPIPLSLTDTVLVWQIDTLYSGQKVDLTFSAFVQSDRPESYNVIYNQASVAAENDTNLHNNQAEVFVFVIREQKQFRFNYDIEVAISTNLDTVKAGGVFQYEMTAKNLSNYTAFDITLCDTLPNFIEAIDYSFFPDSVHERVLFWSIDSLVASGTFSTALTVKATNSPPETTYLLSNAAVIIADADTNAANNYARVETMLIKKNTEPNLYCDVGLTKTTTTDTLFSNEPVNYLLKLNNTGPANAFSVTLTDTLPDYISIENLSLEADSTFADILFWHFDSISAGEEITISISAIVSSSLSDTILTIKNSAQVTAANDTNYNNNFDFATNTIVYKKSALNLNYDLALFKTSSTDSISPSGRFSYFLKARNLGPQNAYAVTLSDTLPEYVSVEHFDLLPDSISQNLLFWFYDSLLVGEERSLLLLCRLSDNVPDSASSIINSAYISAQKDTNLSNNYASVTITKTEEKALPPLNCDIAVSNKADLDTVLAGESFQYQITVENLSPVCATHISITDSLPDFIQATNHSTAPDSAANNMLFWFFDSLQGGGKIYIYFEAKTASILPDSIMTLINSAQISASNDTNASNNFSQSRVIALPQRIHQDSTFALSVTKTASQDTITTGEELDFTIIVKNFGPATAFNIMLTDTLPDIIIFTDFDPEPDSAQANIRFWQIDSLKPDQQFLVTIKANAPDSLPDSIVPLTNVVGIFAQGDTSHSGKKASSKIVIIEKPESPPPPFKLQVFKTASQDTVIVGEDFSYEIKITNLGRGNAYNISLTDTVPSPISIISAEPAPDSIKANIYFWFIDTLQMGKEFLIKLLARLVEAKIDSSFELTNVVSISAAGDTSLSGKKARSRIIVIEDPNSQKPEFNLGLTKTADVDSVAINEPFSYELKIINYGPGIAYDITVTDTLPTVMSVLETNPEPTFTRSNIYFWLFDSLRANQEIVITLLVKINKMNPDSLSYVDNVAEISAAGDTSLIGKKARVRVIVIEPIPPAKDFKLGLSKSADKDSVRVGELFNYELQIINYGPAVAFDITLVDTLPTTISVFGFDPPPASISQSIAIWKFATLAVNEAQVVTISAMVKPELADSVLTVDNVAFISAPGDTSRMGKKARCRIAVIEEQNYRQKNYNLAVTKRADQDTVNIGEEFGYFISLMNYGPHMAYDVILCDTMPALATAFNFQPKPDSARGNLLYWSFPSLAAGQAAQVSYVAVFECSLPEAIMPIKNIAQIIAENDTNKSDDSAESVTIILELGISNCETDYYFDENLFLPDKGQPLNIYFKLNNRQVISLELYDISGYHLSTLVEDEYARGLNKYQWNGRTESNQLVGSGVYIIALRSTEMTCWKKIILVR